MSIKNTPNFFYEESIGNNVCGLDEVGRGPLAGPVVAACVLMPQQVKNMDFTKYIRDSKKLSKTKLKYLHEQITALCPYAIAEVSPQKIDEINILQASLLAMKHSFSRMKGTSISHALIDGKQKPDLSCPSTAIIGGDAKSITIAAASIIAKVHRDMIMQDLAKEFPEYGWDRNAGYPTAEHLHALRTFGFTPHHRKTFGPVAVLVNQTQNNIKDKIAV